MTPQQADKAAYRLCGMINEAITLRGHHSLSDRETVIIHHLVGLVCGVAGSGEEGLIAFAEEEDKRG